jgi:rubrerythrin
LPADGRRVVLRDIEMVNRKVRKVYKTNAKLEEDKYNELTGHLDSLSQLISETFPKLSRPDFYRTAASTMSGERVTNIFKALGIYLAELEKPSPLEVEIAKAIDGARKEREKQRAGKELIEAAIKYSELSDK